MRQTIRQADLDRLSPNARKALLKWEQDNNITLPDSDYLIAPAIGELIAFLSQRIPLDTHFELLREAKYNGEWGLNCTDLQRFGITCPELIDTLWTEVWAILDNDHEE